MARGEYALKSNIVVVIFFFLAIRGVAWIATGHSKERKRYESAFSQWMLRLSTTGMILTGLASFALTGDRWYVRFPLFVRWTGVALGYAACIVFALAHWSLSASWSAFVSLREHHRLITKGVYAYTRHPMYLAALLAYTCVFLATGFWILALCCVWNLAYLFARVPLEEALMIAQFGEEYKQYKREVGALCPCALLPCNCDRDEPLLLEKEPEDDESGSNGEEYLVHEQPMPR